ncbi:hypothetical protein RirG_011620 [Rhizophagus irregularis DAOM 197198w]|uniref:Uncharacterized protein n=1 Tax=Rhizophagus irregularis (strain DAOM 197198w) TaxID=1432141 RepID=A0A015KAL8_RHIIW|nr:hypothetical protein RirG_011620 [Rhizophagus irregularis DAOM 197198w]
MALTVKLERRPRRIELQRRPMLALGFEQAIIAQPQPTAAVAGRTGPAGPGSAHRQSASARTRARPGGGSAATARRTPARCRPAATHPSACGSGPAAARSRRCGPPSAHPAGLRPPRAGWPAHQRATGHRPSPR